MATHSPNSGDSLYSQDSASFRKIYQQEVEVYEQSTDFWRPFEGASASSPIWSKTDTSKGRGSKMVFTVKSGFYNEAVLGDTKFEDDDYEDIKIGSYELQVDWLRHGTSYTLRAEEHMGLRGELVMGIPEEQGKWLGREKTDRLMMMFRHRGGTANYTFAGNASSVDSLTTADTFSHDMVVENVQQLKTMNGKPAMIGTDGNRNEIKRYIVVPTTETLNSLETDPDYQRNLRDAGERGKSNDIFNGGYMDIRGSVVKEYCAYDHDGEGPIGSALFAKAELGTALTNAGIGDFITGGGSSTAAANTKAKYFRFFPNYAYPYLPGETIAVDGAATYYVIVVNNSGADKGKFGFYSYNVNNGTKLTINGALTSSNTTLGGLTWDAAVNTNTHPSGSSVYLVNSKAVVYGWTPIIGAGSALRGYGNFKHKRSEQDVEGGHKKEVYITSVFGQEPRKDRRGRCPGFLVVCHAMSVPGLHFTPTLA